MMSVSEAKLNFNKLVASRKTHLVSKNNLLVSAVVPYEEYRKLCTAYRELQVLKAIEEADDYISGKMGKIPDEQLDELLKTRFSREKEEKTSGQL